MSTLLDRMIENRQLSSVDAAEIQQRASARGAASPQTEEDVLRWLSSEYGVRFSNLEDSEPDRDVLARFPPRFLLKDKLLPLREVDGSVEVATSRLYDTQGLDALRTLSGHRLTPVLAPSEAVEREIKKRLGLGADTIDSLEDDAAFQIVDDQPDEDVDIEQAAQDASIIRFVNQVLSDAIDLRTTDVHVEPFEDELRIRYRIDGILQDVPVPGQIKRFQPAIVSRIKILSHLNIAEKRLPQDGRIKIRVKKSDVDIRVSVIPMLHGEAVVMRLLRQDGGVLKLDGLRMNERERQLMDRALALPHGIILVTGPTGSGKTTTLYAALGEINDSVRKIITIEDPVEYQMKGINQIQVSEKAGLTFARGLRAILRHDPDILLIGEIRDRETAQIAVQASLTGHLVFSTLHTNDAPGALTRLVDMGVEPYLVASSLEAVLAQRLVRLLCSECKEEDDSERARAMASQGNLPQDTPMFRPTGCRACRNTGFLGRRAVFEMMELTYSIRRALLQGKSSGEIKMQARNAGMRTLNEDGWRLVQLGMTTADEILRVSKAEDVEDLVEVG